MIQFVFYIVLLLLSLLIVKELTPYITYLKRYKIQGIKYHYIPLIGIVGALIKKSKKDHLANLKQILSKDFKDEKILAFNNFHNTEITFLFNDTELIKEFFIKEVDYSIKFDFLNLKRYMDIEFFLEGGNQGLKKKTIFNEFFKQNI